MECGAVGLGLEGLTHGETNGRRESYNNKERNERTFLTILQIAKQ